MNEQVGAAQQRVDLGVGDETGQLQRLGARQLSQPRALAEVAAGENEPVLEARRAQLAPRPHERVEILLRAQVAHGEHVRAVGRGVVADVERRRERDDADPVGIGAVALAHVVGGEPRVADDALGRAHRAPRERPVLPPGQPREVVGERLEGQVVDGHDAGTWAPQGQKAVGRMDQGGAATAQETGQAHLLEPQLGAAPAALDEPVLELVRGGAFLQRPGEAPRVDTRAVGHRHVGVAGVEGDEGHGRQDYEAGRRESA